VRRSGVYCNYQKGDGHRITSLPPLSATGAEVLTGLCLVVGNRRTGSLRRAQNGRDFRTSAKVQVDGSVSSSFNAGLRPFRNHGGANAPLRRTGRLGGRRRFDSHVRSYRGRLEAGCAVSRRHADDPASTPSDRLRGQIPAGPETGAGAGPSARAWRGVRADRLSRAGQRAGHSCARAAHRCGHEPLLREGRRHTAGKSALPPHAFPSGGRPQAARARAADHPKPPRSRFTAARTPTCPVGSHGCASASSRRGPRAGGGTSPGGGGRRSCPRCAEASECGPGAGFRRGRTRRGGRGRRQR
jgi:hypothetical protein